MKAFWLTLKHLKRHFLRERTFKNLEQIREIDVLYWYIMLVA